MHKGMDKDYVFLWNNRISATVVSSAAGYIMESDSTFTRTFRVYIRPREYGSFSWSFWHSNTVDSTWGDGSVGNANLPGGYWRIEAAYLADGGIHADGSIIPGTQVQMTFDGNTYKDVYPDEKFWSDSIQLNIPENHYLVFTWSITTRSGGKVLPYNCETPLVPVYHALGICANRESAELFHPLENCLILPALIAYEKPVRKRIGFLGDSITQGVRTQIDGYEYWVAKIAEGLGAEYGVWNIGSGWARAKDAASDGAWLYKAKQNDVVVICLGVNDIGTLNRNANEIVSDLTTIIGKIKQNNPECKVILFTLPTFDFTGDQETVWREVNQFIRLSPPAGVDRVFDIAEVLSEPFPKDNLLKPEYHSYVTDPHPNGDAGTAIANAFLEWYHD